MWTMCDSDSRAPIQHVFDGSLVQYPWFKWSGLLSGLHRACWLMPFGWPANKILWKIGVPEIGKKSYRMYNWDSLWSDPRWDKHQRWMDGLLRQSLIFKLLLINCLSYEIETGHWQCTFILENKWFPQMKNLAVRAAPASWAPMERGQRAFLGLNILIEYCCTIFFTENRLLQIWSCNL